MIWEDEKEEEKKVSRLLGVWVFVETLLSNVWPIF